MDELHEVELMSRLDSNVTFFLLCTLPVLFVTFLCLDWWKKIEFEKKYAKNVSVLPYFPVVGSVLHYIFAQKDPLNMALNLNERFGSKWFFWFFTMPYYVTSDPDEIKVIVTHRNTFDKPDFYRFMEPFIHRSLVLLPGTEWKKRRKIISRCFNQSSLDRIIPKFSERADDFINTIGIEENEAIWTKKIGKYLFDNFLYNICKIDLDEKLGNENESFDISHYTKMHFHETSSRFLNPLYQFDFIFNETPLGKEMLRMKRTLKSFSFNVIQVRRRKREEPDFSEELDGLSMIDALDKEGVDSISISGEILFFGAAAAETSTNLILMALTMLALYQDIQEKVHDEVTITLGNDGFLDHKLLSRLKYTEMVLLETLRIFTPAPLVSRSVAEDLDLGDKILPKGTTIVLNLLGANRNEKYWKDPLKFDPDRFLPQEVEERHPFSFVPFSAGPRNCIGWKYSLMTSTVMLSQIIRTHKVFTSLKSFDEIKIASYVSLYNLSTYSLNFSPRNSK